MKPSHIKGVNLSTDSEHASASMRSSHLINFWFDRSAAKNSNVQPFSSWAWMSILWPLAKEWELPCHRFIVSSAFLPIPFHFVQFHVMSCSIHFIHFIWCLVMSRFNMHSHKEFCSGLCSFTLICQRNQLQLNHVQSKIPPRAWSIRHHPGHKPKEAERSIFIKQQERQQQQRSNVKINRRNSCLYGTKHGSCFSIRSLTGNGRKSCHSKDSFSNAPNSRHVYAGNSDTSTSKKVLPKYVTVSSLFVPFSPFFVTLLVRAVFWIGCFSRSVYKGPAFVPPFEAHFSVKQVPGGLRLVVFTGKSWNIIMYV